MMDVLVTGIRRSSLPLLLTAVAACASPTPTSPTPAVGCPVGTVHIPAGAYLLGRTVDVPAWDSKTEGTAPDGFWALPNPQRSVDVAGFCIDVYEYPNKEGVVPRTNVGWAEADSLCREAGKRLLTRIEWQAASQGLQGRRYSYGATFDPDRCHTQAPTATPEWILPSGRFPACASPLGVHDLNGSVSEWVSDIWEGPWHDNEAWGGPDEAPPTLMGGTAWPGQVYGQDSTSRHRHRRGEERYDDGFRCGLTP